VSDELSNTPDDRLTLSLFLQRFQHLLVLSHLRFYVCSDRLEHRILVKKE